MYFLFIESGVASASVLLSPVFSMEFTLSEPQRAVLTRIGVKDLDAAQRGIEASTQQTPILAAIDRMIGNDQSTGTLLKTLLEDVPGVEFDQKK